MDDSGTTDKQTTIGEGMEKKMNDGMRKLAAKATAIILAALVAASVCGCKPADMDQTTYDLGQEAVKVGESYMSGKTHGSDAKDKLMGIYEELDAYTPENSSSHGLVKFAVIDMARDINPFLSTTDYEKFEEDLEELKDRLK